MSILSSTMRRWITRITTIGCRFMLKGLLLCCILLFFGSIRGIIGLKWNRLIPFSWYNCHWLTLYLTFNALFWSCTFEVDFGAAEMPSLGFPAFVVCAECKCEAGRVIDDGFDEEDVICIGTCSWWPAFGADCIDAELLEYWEDLSTSIDGCAGGPPSAKCMFFW